MPTAPLLTLMPESNVCLPSGFIARLLPLSRSFICFFDDLNDNRRFGTGTVFAPDYKVCQLIVGQGQPCGRPSKNGIGNRCQDGLSCKCVRFSWYDCSSGNM